jgi:cytochrome c556
MSIRPILAAAAVTLTAVSFVLAAEDTNPIKEAMKFAHKAPKGEKKLNEKITEGTAAEADIKKALELYKAMADTKPPKGDAAAFKVKTNKLVAATEEVLAKNPDGVEHYKTAVDCKACHSDFRVMPKGGPGGPGGPGPGPGPATRN